MTHEDLRAMANMVACSNRDDEAKLRMLYWLQSAADDEYTVRYLDSLIDQIKVLQVEVITDIMTDFYGEVA